MKITAGDFKVESKDQRDLNENVKDAWNGGLYEIKTITDSQPSWTERVDGVQVLSISGGVRKLYTSDTSTPNGWVFTTLTAL